MHRSRAAIASLLTAILLLLCVSPSFAASRSEFEAHRKAAENARKRAAAATANAKKLSSEVAELDKEIDRLESQANALEPQIAKAAERTAKVQAEVNRLTAEVDEVKQEIEVTQAEYDRQKQLLASRVQSTYRQGEWFYLDLLLGSSDITSLIQRTEFITRVINSNNDIAEALDYTEQELSRSKVQLDRSLESVKLKKKEAAEIEGDLRALRNSKAQAAAERESIQGRKSELVAENKANAKRLTELAEEEEAESARIAAELSKAGNGSGLYAGTMAWPVPNSRRITSPFGWRVHPIFGTRKFHTGIDISGNGGHPTIVAAGSGTVIYAGYRGGYGNTTMINHGNGVVTLYAHQSSIGVSVGSHVSKGQSIGKVGSTGYSTGPHLHFEVRVNGSPRNPMQYL